MDAFTIECYFNKLSARRLKSEDKLISCYPVSFPELYYIFGRTLNAFRRLCHKKTLLNQTLSCLDQPLARTKY